MNIGNIGDRNWMDQDRMKELLKQALPPVQGADQGPQRDLWPLVLGRMAETNVAHWPRVQLLDVAMLAGLAVLALFVPASIPLLLYYL